MTVTPSWPGVHGLATTTDGRKAIAGLLAKNAAGVPRSGVFPRHTGALLTGRADLNLDVGIFEAAGVQFGGPVLFSNDAVAQLPSPLVSPGVGIVNYYVVYSKQNENTSPGNDPNNNRVLGTVLSTTSHAHARASGTRMDASGTGLPTGAVEVGTVEMPTGKATTNASGVVITTTAQYTAAAGGVVLLRNQAEENAWTPAEGSQAYRLDLNQFRLRGATAWGPRALVEGVGNCDYGAALPTTDADVPGSSVTFTLAVPTKVVLSYGGMMQVNTGTNAYLNLNIDGATVATAQATGPNVTNTTFGISGGHVVTLAAGSHTIKLTVAGGTAGSCAFKDGFWTAIGA